MNHDQLLLDRRPVASRLRAPLVRFARPTTSLLVAPVVMFVLVFIQSATLALHVKAISPYDEAAHFDYVLRVLDGNVPVPAGQHYMNETIQTWACRPTDKGTSIAGLCGRARPANDAGIPFSGVNYNAQFGPVYYLLAAGGVRVLGLVGIGDFGAARLMSALLYALGAAMLVAVAQRFARTRWALTGLVLAASATGLSLSTGASITPDSMAFLYTAGIVAAALLARSWRSAVVWTATVSALAGLTKPNFVVLAGLGAAILLVRWFNIEQHKIVARDVTGLLAACAAPLLACAATAGGWGLLSRARAAPGANIDGGVHKYLQSSLGPLSRVADHVAALVRPDGGTLPGPAFSVADTSIDRACGLLVVVVVLGACFGSWLWPSDADARAVALLRGVTLAIPASAIMLTVILAVAYQGVHQTASRYALPILAAAAIGTGASVSRRAGPFVAGAGVIVWAAAFVGILG